MEYTSVWNHSLTEEHWGIFQFGAILNKAAVVKIARRNINNLRYADDTTHMAESEEC